MVCHKPRPQAVHSPVKVYNLCRIWVSCSCGYEEFYLLGITPCKSVGWHFRGTFRLCLRAQTMSQGRNHKACSKQRLAVLSASWPSRQVASCAICFMAFTAGSNQGLALLPASCWFLALLILWPWRQSLHVPLKHLLTFSTLYSINISKRKKNPLQFEERAVMICWCWQDHCNY